MKTKKKIKINKNILIGKYFVEQQYIFNSNINNDSIGD